MGKPVMIYKFIDVNLMDDLSTVSSRAGIIHLLKNTPIEGYSKLQYCVKTATYGSEYASACICADQMFDLHNNLH